MRIAPTACRNVYICWLRRVAPARAQGAASHADLHRCQAPRRPRRGFGPGRRQVGGGAAKKPLPERAQLSERPHKSHQNNDADNSFTAASISASSVSASATALRQAVTGAMPAAMSLPACTRRRVEAPSSSP